MARPVPTLVALLAWAIAAKHRAEIVDDVLDEYARDIRPTRRRFSAHLWLAVQLLHSAVDSHRQAHSSPFAEHSSRRFMMTAVLVDLRYAIRALARTPWFSLTAVATLAIGIGGALTMYAVAQGVLAEHVPWREPDRLLTSNGSKSGLSAWQMPNYLAVAADVRSLQATAAWQGWRAVLTGRDGTTAGVPAASVTGSFFSLLWVSPTLGRFITAEDDQIGRPPVVVLSYGVWQRFFGGDASIIGRPLIVDGASYTIIGVMSADFIDPVQWAVFNARTVGLWRSAPAVFASGANRPDWIAFWTVERLRDGASVTTASAEAAAAIHRIDPHAQGLTQPLTSLREFNTREIRPTLYALVWTVAGLLLVVCVNVANLMLSRGLGRHGELSVRAALGASRLAIVRQLLVESLVLAVAGAAASLGVASEGVRAVRHLAGATGLGAYQFTVDGTIALAACALAIVTAILFGLVPAIRVSRRTLLGGLREVGRNRATSPRSQRLRQVLIVTETTLAVALLFQAGLLTRSFVKLADVPLGFDTRSTLIVPMNVPTVPFDRVAIQTSGLDDALRAVRALPGVAAVGAISDMPMSGAVNSTDITPPDHPQGPPVETLTRAVAGDYFLAMDIHLVQGRLFTPSDSSEAHGVALVNEEFARRYFGAVNPIGHGVTVRDVPKEIVGVVGNVKEFTPSGGWNAALYTPYAQERQDWMRITQNLVVRSAGTPIDPAIVRAALLHAAAGSAVGRIVLTGDYVDQHFAAPRLEASVVGALAAVAVLLAAVGLGGVLACGVAERRDEMAIRVALGATPAAVAQLVVMQSLRLTAAGLVLGLALGFVMSRLVANLLFRVERFDAAVVLIVCASVVVSAGIASWLPARRALHVDPIETLRAS